MAHLDLGGVRLEDNVLVTEVSLRAACVLRVCVLCISSMLVRLDLG